MLRICTMTMMGLILCSLLSAQQDRSPKPIVASTALSAEQIAVYRAVLQNYVKGKPVALNLSNTTEPSGWAGSTFNGTCLKSVEDDVGGHSAQVVHRLDPSVALNPKMVLVDPDRQEEKINENDPQKLIMGGINGQEAVTGKKVDAAVDKAFATGLFALSEIVFDSQHHRALVAYSFSCGMLCGHGNTLILKKAAKGWRIEKTCSGWVS